MIHGMHQQSPAEAPRFSISDASDSWFADQQIGFPIDPVSQHFDMMSQEPQFQLQQYNNHPMEPQYLAQETLISSFEDRNAFLHNSAAQPQRSGHFHADQEYNHLQGQNFPIIPQDCTIFHVADGHAVTNNQLQNPYSWLGNPSGQLYEAQINFSDDIPDHIYQQVLTEEDNAYQTNIIPDFDGRTSLTPPNSDFSAMTQSPRLLETQSSTVPECMDGWLNEIVCAAYNAGKTEVEVEKAKELTWEKHHTVLGHRGIKVVPQVYAFVFDFLLWHYLFPFMPFPKRWPTIIEHRDPQLHAVLMRYSAHNLPANNSQGQSGLEQSISLPSTQATQQGQPTQAEKERVEKEWKDLMAGGSKSLISREEFTAIVRSCQRRNDQWAREERELRPGRGGAYMPRELKNRKQEQILGKSVSLTWRSSLKVDT